MPKRSKGLTARFVTSCTTPGTYPDGGNLYLQVASADAKSWIFRFKMPGRKRRDMGLGSVSTLTLAAARDAAAECRRQVAAGIDPIEARRAAEAAAAAENAKLTTFKEAAEALLKSRDGSWRNPKHAAQWAATLETYAYPVLGKVAVGKIDTALVLKVLEPIWREKTETASRLRGRIEAVLDYAKVHRWRSGDNAARWKGHLDHILPPKTKVAPVEHHTSLPYSEMPTFWPRLQVTDGIGARALELLILTATRSGEVVHATWPEIDLEAAQWRIPAERTKTRAEHVVPLSAPALALLKKLKAVRTSDYVFPGQRDKRPLSDMAMLQTLRRLKVDAVPHGFRATFRTWAADRGTPDAVAEAALGHAVKDEVIAAYRRTTFEQLRADLMDAWADFVEGRAGKVVQLHRAGRGHGR